MPDNRFKALNGLLSAQSGDRMTLPHPEEPTNLAQTLSNTDVDLTITLWLQNWGVPTQYWDQ